MKSSIQIVKICDGDLHLCPASGVSVCVKSGTTDNDWQGMCTKLSQGLGVLEAIKDHCELVLEMVNVLNLHKSVLKIKICLDVKNVFKTIRNFGMIH